MDQYINNNQLPNEIPPLNIEADELFKDLSNYLKDFELSTKFDSLVNSSLIQEIITSINENMDVVLDCTQERYEDDRDFGDGELTIAQMLADRDNAYNQLLTSLAKLCKDITIQNNPGKYGGLIARGKDLFTNAGGTEDEFSSCEITRNSVYKDTYDKKTGEPDRKNMFDMFAESMKAYLSDQFYSKTRDIGQLGPDAKSLLDKLKNDVSKDYTKELNNVEKQLADAKKADNYTQIRALSEKRTTLVKNKIADIKDIIHLLRYDGTGFVKKNGAVQINQLTSFAKQLDVMDKRAGRQDERAATEIMLRLGVNPAYDDDSVLEEDGVGNGNNIIIQQPVNEAAPEQKSDAERNDNNIIIGQPVNEAAPEQDPDARKNYINRKFDKLINNIERVFEGNGQKPDAPGNDINIRVDQPVVEAAPAQIPETDLYAAEIKLFKEHIKNLEKAKTFKNSDEYMRLIDKVSNLTKDDDVPMFSKLSSVKASLFGYLKHKSKDGVKSNVFKKLAAVEALSKDVDKLFDKLELKKKETVPNADFSCFKTDLNTMIRFASNAEKESFEGVMEFTRDCKLEDYQGLDGTQLSAEQKRKVSTAMNDADICMKKILLGAMNQKPGAINDLVKMKNKFHDAKFAAKEFGFSLTKAPKEQGPLIR